MNNNILSLFNFENVQFEPKACKNFLNNKTVCQECIKSCPVKAIDLEDNLPVINSMKCTNCGLCVTSCEVLAFDNIQKPYVDILKQITEYPDSNITCENDSSHLKGIKIPCYLNLDIHLLIYLSNFRDLIAFYLGNCSSCYKADFNIVTTHVLNLQNQLDELGVPLTIQVNKSKLDEENSTVINGLTRRELFQKISLKKLRNFEFTGEGGFKKNDFNNSLLLKEKILFKRGLFNKYFQKKEREIDSNLIKKQFMSIVNLGSCSGCSICEKICPTGALFWQDEGNLSSLIFNAQACIACEKCSVCPENAIIFESISLNDYLKSEEKKLTTFKLVKCDDCGESFRTNDNNHLCFFCEKKVEQKSVNFFN